VTSHIGFDAPPSAEACRAIGPVTLKFGGLNFFHNKGPFADDKVHERDVIWVEVIDVNGGLRKARDALVKDTGFPYPHPSDKTMHLTLLYAEYGTYETVIQLLKDAGISKLLDQEYKLTELHVKKVRDRTSAPLVFSLLPDGAA